MLGFNAVSTAMVIPWREQGWELIQSLMIESMRLPSRNLPLGSLPYFFSKDGKVFLNAMSHRHGITQHDL